MFRRPLDDKKNCYALLGVSETASEDEIKKAYRKLAIENHPDKGGDPQKFRELCHAFTMLTEDVESEFSYKHHLEVHNNWLYFSRDWLRATRPIPRAWDDEQLEEEEDDLKMSSDNEQVKEEISDQNQPTPSLPPSRAIKRPKLSQDSSTQ